MSRWFSGVLLGAWALVGTDVQAADRYVGVVEGFRGEARVAVVADGERWLVYVCGDSDSINQAASRWWNGKAIDGAFSAESDLVSVTARLEDAKIVGELKTKDGDRHAFAANKIAPGARAGAYRVTATGKNGAHLLSWIVDSEGLVVGCNHGSGKRVALKTAKLPPPTPKRIARRQPKPPANEDAESEEPAEKPAARKNSKGLAKAVEEAEEEDAKPAASAEADADSDDDGEKVVGKKVTTAAPAKSKPKKPAVDDEDNDDETPAKKPVKKKPVDDDDG
jgi:hypothetical protein